MTVAVETKQVRYRRLHPERFHAYDMRSNAQQPKVAFRAASPEMRDRIRAAAKRRGLSVSELIRQALISELGEE